MQNRSFHKSIKLSLSNCALSGNRWQRSLVLSAIDSAIFAISLYIATAIRFESFLSLTFLAERSEQFFILILIQLLVFRMSGVYQSILRYSGPTLIGRVAKSVLLSTAILIICTYFLSGWALARSVLIINALLTLILVVTIRLALKSLIKKSLSQHSRTQVTLTQAPTRLLIYGAGGAGAELLHALSYNAYYTVVGFIDDNRDLQRKTSIEGLNIYSAAKILTLWRKSRFDSVALAMPSASPSVRHRIITQLQQHSIPVKTVPSLENILSGKVTIQALKDVDITDLLGREEVPPDVELLRKQTAGKVVLVTGAGGTIGAELCRQISAQQPQHLVLYERHEFSLYRIYQELSEQFPAVKLTHCLGSVTDGAFLRLTLNQYRIETVYHAAAYKHVPMLECNVSQGIENNVLGTLITAQSVIESGVQQFVLISTDKAVRPTNVMGASKRVAELIVQALYEKAAQDKKNPPQMAIVRFGNVLGSSGSVVPLFRRQIAEGGPITLTHPSVTRYFMSIPEAARLVIQAGAMSQGGEVFLLDMGASVKIYDLAIQMIRLSGLVPDRDIQIEVTGLRPGEKLYEELLIAEGNTCSTRHSKIYCAQEWFISWNALSPKLKQLLNAAQLNDSDAVKGLLQQLVPEYKPSAYKPPDPKQPDPKQPSPKSNLTESPAFAKESQPLVRIAGR